MKSVREFEATMKDQNKRMQALGLEKQDYVFGIALSTSVVIAILSSFMEDEAGKNPPFVEDMLERMRAMMTGMLGNCSEEHLEVAHVKSRMLLEEVCRIVKLPSNIQ